MLKKLANKILSSLNYEVHYTLPEKEQEIISNKKNIELHRWLTSYDFKTIIDIGANEGQFAHKMRKSLLISFEPLPDVYHKLLDSFKDDSFFTSYNFGVGEREENVSMWSNEYSPSSSILKMKEHTDHFDFAVSQSLVNIKIVPLDKVLNFEVIETPYIVKIDVQGFEEYVIKGGKKTLSNAKMIITEVSFRELYENQLLFDGIYLMLKELGFKYAGNYEQLYSPINNEILQADAIFIK
jgi:FkbM family methyltransferase